MKFSLKEKTDFCSTFCQRLIDFPGPPKFRGSNISSVRIAKFEQLKELLTIIFGKNFCKHLQNFRVFFFITLSEKNFFLSRFDINRVNNFKKIFEILKIFQKSCKIFFAISFKLAKFKQFFHKSLPKFRKNFQKTFHYIKNVCN